MASNSRAYQIKANLIDIAWGLAGAAGILFSAIMVLFGTGP